MATTKTKTTNGKPPADSIDGLSMLDSVALRIFSGMSPHLPADRAANSAYVRASAFLAHAERVKERGVEIHQPTREELFLDDGSAPNLPESHPYNMASKQFGSLEKLRVLKSMAADPESYGLSVDDARLCQQVVEMAERRGGGAIPVAD